MIPGKPRVAYQYVAAKVPQNEPDIGFKETIFQTPSGAWVRFIDHSATSSGRRVCAQLHTVYAMVYSSSGVNYSAWASRQISACRCQPTMVP